jgi:hypothetical protein
MSPSEMGNRVVINEETNVTNLNQSPQRKGNTSGSVSNLNDGIISIDEPPREHEDPSS